MLSVPETEERHFSSTIIRFPFRYGNTEALIRVIRSYNLALFRRHGMESTRAEAMSFHYYCMRRRPVVMSNNNTTISAQRKSFQLQPILGPLLAHYN